MVRQTNVKNDVASLGDCVEAIGHTVMLLEPWNDPRPLRRAYCIKDIYHTLVSGAMFNIVMTTKQQQAFGRALVTEGADGFDWIQAGMSQDTNSILDEVEQKVGFVECNRRIIDLMREALVARWRDCRRPNG